MSRWGLRKLLEPLNSFVDILFEEEDLTTNKARQTLRQYLLQAHNDDSGIPAKGRQEELALLCLQVLNGTFSQPISGARGMENPENITIPKAEIALAPEVWYACRWWSKHLVAVETNPSVQLLLQLRRFTSVSIRTWIAVMTSRGQFTRFNDVREWYNMSKVLDTPTRNSLYSPRLGALHHNLATAFVRAHRFQEAFGAESEALEIWRDLFLRNPAVANFEADMAICLSGMAVILSCTNRLAEAVTRSKEAVEIAERLVNLDPPAVKPADLARYKVTLARILGELDILDESLAMSQQAVEILRQLQGPDNGDLLVPCLVALSKAFSRVGREEEAVLAIEEAVQIDRKSLQQSPHIDIPRFSNNLVVLSERLSAVGRDLEALDFLEEAISIHRLHITRVKPHNTKKNYAPNFSKVLTARFSLHIKIKRFKAALESAEEAVRILRDLEPNPSDMNVAYQLFTALVDLATILNLWGRRGEADAMLEEAMGILRGLMEKWPTFKEFEPLFPMVRLLQLGHALHREETLVEIQQITATLKALGEGDEIIRQSVEKEAKCLAALGRREEALIAARENLTIAQKVPKASIDRCYRALSGALADLGQRDEAFDAGQQAMEHSSPAEIASTGFTLEVYVLRLAELGRKEEALVNAERLIQLREQLSSDELEVNRDDIARWLHSLSNRLYDLDRKAEALAPAQEAISLYRIAMKDGDSDDFRVFFIRTLNDLARLLGDLGRNDEALASVREALELLDAPSSFCHLSTKQQVRAECLTQLALHLFALGQADQAVVEIQISVDIYRDLAARYPTAFNHLLAKSLNILFTCSGDVQAIHEAFELLHPVATQWPAVFAKDLADLEQNILVSSLQDKCVVYL
ncbi:hypothetical protein C8J56DRAFT_912281 [Mycena floridula]|nr:hypothetical protein C8J56DRAFT_912281 [Mycena floridula]